VEHPVNKWCIGGNEFDAKCRDSGLHRKGEDEMRRMAPQ